MKKVSSKTETTTTTSRLAQTKPGAISAALVILAITCGLTSQLWAPLRWINEQCEAMTSGDGVMVAIGVASVAAIGAGFAGVVVAYAISSERPVVVEFRSKVGPLLKSNWLSVIGCSFSAAILGLVGATLFAASVPTIAAWTSILAVALLLHGVLRNMYLFSVFLKVVALGDERDKQAAAVVPLSKVVTKRTS